MGNWVMEQLGGVAEKNNGRTALADGRQAVTYGELICRIAYLSEKLKGFGIKKGDVCAVLCGRNVDTVVSVFSVWAVGGVYLPVNPAGPDDRNNYTVSKAGAKVVIDTAECRDAVPGFSGKYASVWLRPDYDGRTGDCLLQTADTQDGDAAYILFTSGSTGVPKGVKISVGNLKNLFYGLREGVFSRFGENLRVALVAPFLFDASIQQLLSSLLLGHTLYITGENQRRNPVELWEFLMENDIRVFDCTPTHIRMLNSVLGDRSIGEHPLQCILVGGEALHGETVQAFAGKFAGTCPYLVNVYGVTECAVDSVYYFFRPEETECGHLVPIGIPMAGVELAVVGENGRNVPDGSIGELCIGGKGVGLGYLDKELDTGRFVNLEEYPGVPFYRTGDMAKVDNNRRFICLGRNDRQVKVRGNRIELDEIEACIMGAGHFRGGGTVCRKCLLDSHCAVIHPDGVCGVCHSYEKNADAFRGIFGMPEDFKALMEKANAGNESGYDCMLLYSGGKDSTYVLMRLMEMGYRVLAYTFDNGYLSEQAFRNIRNITEALGVDSVIENFPGMDGVFEESIRRYHTVCDGCYKVLVTLSTKYAVKHGIRAIVNGLDRGQLMETKLKGLLEQGLEDRAVQYLAEQRKIYHYWNDHFYSLVDTPGEPEEIDKISFLDFYFYEDADEGKILAHLAESSIWERSRDTGLCSTNCRINDVGTAAFYRANGFHNYAAPLSWEVRLGQMTREEGIGKLSMERFDYKYIAEKLKDFGADTKTEIKDCHVVLADEKLFAFISPTDGSGILEIQSYLKKKLPSYMMPHRFLVLEQFPLTESGKIDYRALEALAKESISGDTVPKNGDPVIAEIMGIWEKILGYSDFGVDDSFFDAGGDSLDAIMMAEEIKNRFHCDIPFHEILEKITVSGIANHIRSGGLQ